MDRWTEDFEDAQSDGMSNKDAAEYANMRSQSRKTIAGRCAQRCSLCKELGSPCMNVGAWGRSPESGTAEDFALMVFESAELAKMEAQFEEGK